MKELLNYVATLSNCQVLPKEASIEELVSDYIIPEDLKEFYMLCGGMILFDGSPYAVKIVGPREFKNANYEILGSEIIDAEIKKGTYENEISKDWFIIADLSNSDYIVIDLKQERSGFCYKAFWDSYPEEGSTTIIAKSFKELLERLIDNNGKYWFFLQEDFVSYGDAYDYKTDSK